MDTRLKPAGPDIVFEEFDGDLVVLNLSTGRYFGFNPAAATLWAAIAAGVVPAELQAQLPAGLDMSGFVRQLQENALVVAAAEPPVPLDAAMQLRLAGLQETPLLEVYDDLSDLIVADPIHDTDEARGWPVLPPQG